MCRRTAIRQHIRWHTSRKPRCCRQLRPNENFVPTYTCSSLCENAPCTRPVNDTNNSAGSRDLPSPAGISQVDPQSACPQKRSWSWCIRVWRGISNSEVEKSHVMQGVYVQDRLRESSGGGVRPHGLMNDPQRLFRVSNRLLTRNSLVTVVASA